MQFNEKLKELRTKKCVSQSELADNIYVSRSAVAKWENGLGLPSAESLRLLAEYFEVSSDELYSDSSTEKVIVNKNQIISHSRKILIIISTACAVMITAIIVLAIVLGYQMNKSTPGNSSNRYTGPLGVAGWLYSDYEYNEATGYFTQSQESRISSERNEAILENEIVWEKYTLSAGQTYVLEVRSSPSGYNGIAFGISADLVGFKYNTDIFDIVMVHDSWRVYYMLTVKQPCQNEAIWLYRKEMGEQVTEQSEPSFKIIISATAPSDELL